MQRLGRTRLRQGFVPVAAEVLELRDLLSSAAAAVHGATHHAAIQQSADQTGAIAPLAFHGTVNAAVAINSGTPKILPGQFSLSTVKLVNGAHVSGHFTFSLTSGASKISLKGKFAGTISGFGPVPGGTLCVLTPTGGSITLTSNLAGPTVKAKAVPGASVILLGLTPSNSFGSLAASDAFPAGSAGGLGGSTITILIGL